MRNSLPSATGAYKLMKLQLRFPPHLHGVPNTYWGKH